MSDLTDPARKRGQPAHPTDAADQSAAVGVAAAAGRDHYVDAQIGQAEAAVRAQVPSHYNGDLYRAIAPTFTATYSNHSQSDPGRYNQPGQSALYTAPTLADVRAETANYQGLDGKVVVRSHFQGELLDLRQTPGLTDGALTQGHGGAADWAKQLGGGRERSLLARITGEDAYTLPRALGDVARERGLSGVIAPANHGNTNVALFPDHPEAATGAPGRIQTGLRRLDHVRFRGDAPGPATAFAQPHSNVADATPNKLAPPGVDLQTVDALHPEVIRLATTDQHQRMLGIPPS